MGVVKDWKSDLLAHIRSLDSTVSVQAHSSYFIYALGDGKILLNLLDITNGHDPDSLILFQEELAENGIQLLQLWEDVWLMQKPQVLSRLQSILGLNSRIHGRKTTVVSLTQPQADQFMNDNHLQLAVGSRYKYGLLLNGELVAAACFSSLRKMGEKGTGYRSAEIIRFANKNGYTVTGGFTKLLKHFISCHKPNDVMSYADRDWSLGAAYERAGFRLAEITPSSVILLNKLSLQRVFPHRVPEMDLKTYTPIFNTGNLKYILDL